MSKYGLMVYNYQKKSETYQPDSVNIGDYIQSLAAKQFLPQVDTLIDRDSISDYDGEVLKMIMNGRWTPLEGNESLSPKIDPLFVSYHLDSYELKPEMLAYLKQYEPIGCRDIGTQEYLEKKGISAYFSGCMTLTLGKQYQSSESERTDEIIFNDLDWKPERNNWKATFGIGKKGKTFQRNKKINDFLRQFILPSEEVKITYTSHLYPLGKAHQEYFDIAEDILKRYSKAKLVVTPRIHCALPCVAMGTPVIFMFEKYDEKRYKKLIDFLNYIDLSNDIMLSNLKIMQSQGRAILISPTKHLAYVEELEKRISEFMT